MGILDFFSKNKNNDKDLTRMSKREVLEDVTETISSNINYFRVEKILNYIPLGGSFYLRILDPTKIKEESMTYLLTSNTEDVKKYLPGAYASTKEQAKALLDKHILSVATELEIVYRICLNSGTIGYVIVGTGRMNHIRTKGRFFGFTVDFWMMEMFRGKNIATSAVSNTVKFLFDSGLDEVYALVDPENYASQRVLEKCSFVRIPNVDWHFEDRNGNPYLYRVENPSIK